MTVNSKLLALDFGEKRIGIAVSDENKKYSFARDYMQNDKDFLPGIFRLIREENITRIIIGYPLNFKSEKTIQTEKTEAFRKTLEDYLFKNSYTADIIFFDERLTSKIAESGLLNSGMKKKKRQEKGIVDSMSAQIILQDYIDKLKNQEDRI